MKTLVIIPTYLEAENIADVLGKVRSAAPHVHVLVVDDASPDGTADLARAAGEQLGQVDVLARPGKGGLGGAYRAGFQRAFSEGYEVVVQMDADLSHPPDRLGALLAEVDKGADIAIGSRYVKGGATANWPLVRRLLSRTANIYASLMLGLGVHDATAGFRAYRADILQLVEASATKATGYGFQLELSYRAHRLGARIVEVPITFNDRVRGVSKMSWHIIGEAMSLVAWWALRDRILRRSGPIAERPPRAEAGAPSPVGIAADLPTAVVSGGVPDNPAAREPDVEAAAK
ncbi:MAG TPA: polyprenol monophosphomannose synthase [Acidimicrobiales bacterium]|nr:polyprenol monophosphomannose synthase [Acidimicrobiales bacterium]